MDLSFPPNKGQQNTNNANVAENLATPAPSASSTTSPTATPATAPSATPGAPVPVAPQDAVARQTVTVRTPLYDVKLDSHGAVATSWIINKLVGRNDDRERPIGSVAGYQDPSGSVGVDLARGPN